MPEFRPPSFINARPYDEISTPQGLDAIFNAYQRTKQLEQSQGLQRGENLLKYGLDPSQVTPETMQQASMPAPEGPGIPQEPGHVVAARAYLEKRNKAQGLEDRLKESEITKNLREPKAGGIGDPEQVAMAMLEGRMAPSQLPGFGQNSLKAQALARAFQINPKFSPQEAELNFKGKTAETSFEHGQGAQKPARLMKSLLPTIDYLQQLSDGIPSTEIKLINRLGLAGAAAAGSAQAQEIIDASNIVADEFQAMIGGGSNAKLELGMNLFESSKTPEQLRRTLANVKANLVNRSNALTGQEIGNGASFYGQQQKKSAEERFSELEKKGIPEVELYKKMASEGYR